MVLVRSRSNSVSRVSRAAQQPSEMYSAAGEQFDSSGPSTSAGDALFVDVRSSTPPLAGRPSSAADSRPPSPSLLLQYGREMPGLSQPGQAPPAASTRDGREVPGLSQPGHAPPAAAPQPIVMTEQQLVCLLQAVRSQPPVQGGSTTYVQSVPQTVSSNLSNCTSRFDGKGDVTAFIDSVQIYKDCVGVTDDIALRGLPMLLVDFAATWWQAVKHSVNSWQNALYLLRQTFGPRFPPLRIYREIFSKEQGVERTDVFVCRVRALIAQLAPNTLPEDPVQLDMVYSLLHRRIREKVPRAAFNSFDEMLKHA
ncbi:unnamed protein product [Euphydryas editha]|uniref:Gag protein n=1 Tax=Euphydryas editha TaxID=104508 RepID=A0AAU9VA85_EUPED|nr:unnamed protein product [Euphydryas editha]